MGSCRHSRTANKNLIYGETLPVSQPNKGLNPITYREIGNRENFNNLSPAQVGSLSKYGLLSRKEGVRVTADVTESTKI
jgi:hypothetical protein